MTPSRLGQYEIRRTIGRGGMGTVYEAVHSTLEKRVAIKVLHQRLASDARLVARFLDEGRAAARIRHPHVVDIADVGTAEGVPYLVMELLEGEPLSALIAREAPLPSVVVADLMLPLCSALRAAHDQGVLHRDLKPENVFLARSGAHAGAHPKVVDFGIAKVHDVGRENRTGREVMGTPHYMSVEQARNPSTVDPRADQYSLGVIAYECVTGRLPYPGRSVGEVFAMLALGQAPSPRSIVPSIPDELEAVVMRAMARDADDRFPSVRELGGALVSHASPRARSQWARAFGRSTSFPAAISGAPQGLSRTPGPSRVLVIEDDANVRANLVELLECEGFEPFAAASGEDGLVLAREKDADLVLCDVGLPGMDGYSVVRALRADASTASTPFIFLSGRGEMQDVRAGMKVGADDYLTKPFARQDVLDAVRARLARFSRFDSSIDAPEPGHAPTMIASPASRPRDD